MLDSGLLASLPSRAVYADLSTTSIALALELANEAREADVDVLDVEMSGSTPQVESGELVLFVGGDADVLERVRPLFEPIAKSILLHKDFDLILGHAQDANLDLPATEASAEVCAAALESETEDVDFSAVIRHMERQVAVPRA